MHGPLRLTYALLANYMAKCQMSSGPYGPNFVSCNKTSGGCMFIPTAGQVIKESTSDGIKQNCNASNKIPLKRKVQLEKNKLAINTTIMKKNGLTDAVVTNSNKHRLGSWPVKSQRKKTSTCAKSTDTQTAEEAVPSTSQKAKTSDFELAVSPLVVAIQKQLLNLDLQVI